MWTYLYFNRIKQTVDDYLADTSEEALIIMSDFKKIQYAFSVMKGYIKDKTPLQLPKSTVVQSDSNVKSITVDEAGLSSEQIQQFEKLKMLVAHRDNEISKIM